jgi:hypothetical protein
MGRGADPRRKAGSARAITFAAGPSSIELAREHAKISELYVGVAQQDLEDYCRIRRN